MENNMAQITFLEQDLIFFSQKNTSRWHKMSDFWTDPPYILFSHGYLTKKYNIFLWYIYWKPPRPCGGSTKKYLKIAPDKQNTSGALLKLLKIT